MKPREIAAEMIEEMNKTAGEVWRKRETEVPAEHRADWRKLVWSHVVSHYARERK